MGNWGEWQSIDAKRMDKAKGKDMTPLQLDSTKKIGTFASSEGGLYYTSLADCSCPDFTIQGGIIPCKHICRLAMEFGMVDSTGMQSDVEEAKHKLEKANLLKMAREGELLEIAPMFAIISKILDKQNIKYDSFVACYGEQYFLSAMKSGKCKIEKQYAADVKSALAVVQKRIGAMVMPIIDQPTVIDALQEAYSRM